jgi:hypothetical protein
MKYTCLVCGKVITRGFYYCNRCAMQFGMADEKGKFKRPLEWPDWARFLYNDERKRRRMEKKIILEVEYTDEFSLKEVGLNGKVIKKKGCE